MPESKAHLVQATRAITGKQTQFEQVEDDSDDLGLKDGFEWYMNPQDKGKYEQIYQENRDMRGEISCKLSQNRHDNYYVVTDSILTITAVHSLENLYESLDVPDTDVRSAWNLVNPSAGSTINKDACLAFLHILNNRHEGFRIPRTVPPSLRSTFERNQIDYQVDNQRGGANSRWATKADDSTATGRKAKFGDQYLTRLGRSGFKTAGTDFSTEKTEDWEEVRLKRQLADLDEKFQKVEEVAERRKGGKRDSKPALVKKELDQLLDYKRRQLRELEEGSSKGGSGGSSLKSIQEDLETVREQVDGLVSHLRTREQALEQIRQEIEDERAGR